METRTTKYGVDYKTKKRLPEVTVLKKHSEQGRHDGSAAEAAEAVGVQETTLGATEGVITEGEITEGDIPEAEAEAEAEAAAPPSDEAADGVFGGLDERLDEAAHGAGTVGEVTVRQLVDEIFELADSLVADGRLSCVELSTFLRGTQFAGLVTHSDITCAEHSAAGFAMWLTRGMKQFARFDVDHNGTMEKQEMEVAPAHTQCCMYLSVRVFQDALEMFCNELAYGPAAEAEMAPPTPPLLLRQPWDNSRAMGRSYAL